jgi:hypothetical protein
MPTFGVFEVKVDLRRVFLFLDVDPDVLLVENATDGYQRTDLVLRANLLFEVLVDFEEEELSFEEFHVKEVRIAGFGVPELEFVADFVFAEYEGALAVNGRAQHHQGLGLRFLSLFLDHFEVVAKENGMFQMT